VTGAIGLLTLLQLAGAFVESHFGSSIVPGAWLTADSGWYWTILAGLIVLFTYVCNFSVILPGLADDQPSLAEQIKKKGFFVPSFRPGTATEGLFSRTILRISLFGGLGLALLAAGVPYLVLRLTQHNILIMVLTVIIIVKTLVPVRARFEAYGRTESYGDFLKRPRRVSR
jgi:preprotein translocase subunit SecY